MKECSCCHETKSLAEFYFNQSLNRYSAKCKLCDNKKSREYYYKNHEAMLAQKISYRLANEEKCAESLRKSYQRYKEKRLEKNHKYYVSKRLEILQQSKEYYLKNKEKIGKRNMEYHHRIAKHIPSYRLNRNMACLIRETLKGNKNGWHWEDIVGYSLKELMERLEKQFAPGMTWKNYGTWHIDHIYPKSLFKINSVHDDEFKKCWALSNLQPLWAQDNKRKHAKVCPLLQELRA